MRRASANLLLLCAGAIWGMGFIAQSTAMDAIGPVFFTGIRFAFAALTLLPLAIFEDRRLRAKGTATAIRPWPFVLPGLVLFASLTSQQIGLMTTTVTNSGFLTGIYVVLVPIMTVLILRIWPHPVVWPGAVLVLAGIYLLSGGALQQLTRGDIWTLGCAFLWAIHVMMLGRLAPGTDRPMLLAHVQFLTCAVTGILIGLAIEPVSMAMIWTALPEILFAGIVSGGVAFSLQVIAQRHTTAPQAAIFLASEALFAALFGMLFLGERLAGYAYLGCGLIFAAVVLVELVPMHTARRRARAGAALT